MQLGEEETDEPEFEDEMIDAPLDASEIQDAFEMLEGLKESGYFTQEM